MARWRDRKLSTVKVGVQEDATFEGNLHEGWFFGTGKHGNTDGAALDRRGT